MLMVHHACGVMTHMYASGPDRNPSGHTQCGHGVGAPIMVTHHPTNGNGHAHNHGRHPQSGENTTDRYAGRVTTTPERMGRTTLDHRSHVRSIGCVNHRIAQTITQTMEL